MPAKPKRRSASAGRRRPLLLEGDTPPHRDVRDLAQAHAYAAMETTDPAKALRELRAALRLDPACVDALWMLASFAARTREEYIELLRMTVKVAIRTLGGPRGLARLGGRFWSAPRTRPYLRARATLARALLEACAVEDAIREYEELLALDPRDNQGVRWRLLAARLMERDPQRMADTLERFAERGAVWTWARALERWLAGDARGAGRALAQARRFNRRVEAYLLGKPTARGRSTEISPGELAEAQLCADCLGLAWKQAPGALEWLAAAKSPATRHMISNCRTINQNACGAVARNRKARSGRPSSETSATPETKVVNGVNPRPS